MDDRIGSSVVANDDRGQVLGCVSGRSSEAFRAVVHPLFIATHPSHCTCRAGVALRRSRKAAARSEHDRKVAPAYVARGSAW